MDDDFIKYGGKVGAALTFWLTVSLFFLFAMILIFRSLDKSNTALSLTDERVITAIIGLVLGLICSITIATPVALLGYLLGKAAVKCSSVNRAFFQGASVIIALPVGLFLAEFYFLFNRITFSWRDVVFVVIVSTIFVVSSSMISGLTAIYVRDYRYFGRKRLFPQFTLQEMMLIFTLVAIIISSLTSIVVLF
jgi:hypothetical protein